MSACVWKLDKDLCRCCHSEGSFHNLQEPRFVLGQTEVYTDMIKSCLDIQLTPVSGVYSMMTFTICEPCITRLRDATNFRHQVQMCEERFDEMYRSLGQEFTLKQENTGIDEENEVKDEYMLMDEVHGADGYEDSDDDRPVIKIKVEGPKKRTREQNRSKTRPKETKVKIKKEKKRVEKETEGDGADEGVDGGEEGELEAEGEEKKQSRGTKRHPKFVLKDTDYTQQDSEYTCAHCNKKYDKIFSLRFHIKTKHYKIPRFTCSYCKKEFMTPAPLTIHKLNEHNIDERFKCKACNAAFNTKVQLRKHINNFHMLGEKYKCEFCDYESFSFEGMYKHKFKHKTVKDYHCRFCRKSFLRKATLDLHERIHTGDRRKVCKVCGQAFVQKASLNYHMTKYHPEVNF